MGRLDLRDTLGYLLRKQHLAPQAGDGDLLGVVGDIVGLHATRPTTPHLSALARIPGFRRDWLEGELYVTRRLVRVKCMRGTVFIVPRAALGGLVAATRRAVESNTRRYLASSGVSLAECDRLAPRIVEVLRGRELTVAQMRAVIGKEPDLSSAVALLCDQGVLVRTRPARSWRDATNAYALMAEWLPEVDFAAVPEQEAITRMVRAYIDAYGPVTESDIAWWAGLKMAEVRAALAQLAPELARVEVLGLEGSFLMLHSQVAAVEGAGVMGNSAIALLPVLDPYLMGYRERSRQVDAAVADRVFDRGGNGTSTILVDGRVVGVWDAVERPTPAVQLHLFIPGNDDLLWRLGEQARRIGAFLFDEEVEVQRLARMAPVTSRPTGAYSPFEGAEGVHTIYSP